MKIKSIFNYLSFGKFFYLYRLSIFGIIVNLPNYLKKKIANLKVCICTLGKNENKYISEFVEHYKNYGVDKIYLYDNNDKKGERFEHIIGNNIDSGFVDLINWRGIKGN
jgi:hypothetical protein